MNKYFLRYKKTYNKEHPNINCKATVYIDILVTVDSASHALQHVKQYYDFLVEGADLEQLQLQPPDHDIDD